MLELPCKRCGKFGHSEKAHDEQTLVGADGKLKYANLVVLKKTHEKARAWEPVAPEDVPEWLKDPQVMGHLVRGNCASNESKGKEWFCALPPEKATAVLNAQAKAQEKRDRRARKRAGQVRIDHVQAAHAVKH